MNIRLFAMNMERFLKLDESQNKQAMYKLLPVQLMDKSRLSVKIIL